MIDKKTLAECVVKALEAKGKRKFVQSMEIIVNVTGVDFSKSENRLNLDVLLPKGKGGKELKCGVIAEEALGNQAKKAGADLIILPSELPAYSEKNKAKDLADNYFLLAQPNLMAAVAKNLGQYLGKKGKLPKPIIGNITDLIDKSKRSIRIVTKGRYLPTVQAFIGTENMNAEELKENAESVLDAVKAKVNEGNIRSVFVKLTMGKPVRVICWPSTK
jgi:large subunit ribosomal protein L1